MTELVFVANAGDATISALRLHRDGEPRLETLALTRLSGNCGTFAIDADRDLVFAAVKGEPNAVVTLRLDRATGELTEISRRDVEDSMTYLSLAHGGRVLLGASYGGGFGQAWPLDGEHLGEPTARLEFANLHCVVTEGRWAYFVSLGDDLIAQYEVGKDGTLTPLGSGTVAAPTGSGPRHLILDADNAYLVTEFSGELIRYAVGSDGALEPGESVSIVDPSAGLSRSRIGADPTEEQLIWGADVHVADPWVLASERSASTIATVSRDAQGRLGEVVGFAKTETQPRGFTVTADGAYAVAVGERSTYAQLSRVGEDGSLSELQRVEVGSGANWVRIIPE